jgi:hypothetical protein
VVSVHTNRGNLRATSRPVVALLTDAQRRVMPRAELLDLATADLGGIVRALSNMERRQLLSDTHPDLAH